MTLFTSGESFLTRDFFPRLSRSLRGVKTPLGSLALAALASGLCGLFLHPQGFVVFFGVVVVTAAGLAWPWLSVLGLSGTLVFDRRRCREGETVIARLTVRNRAPWGVYGVSVRGDSGDGEEDTIVGLAFLPGWRTTSVDFDFVAPCRGEYPRRALRLACGFPFGLWRASRRLVTSEPLLIWPRTFPVAALPDTIGGRTSEGLAARDRPGNWGDPLGVRPYRRGDSLRRVHWGQTARHGELIVCEVQSNSAPCVQILLDTARSSHTGQGTSSSREWAIRIAASLVEGWVGQGADVELIVDGRRFPESRAISRSQVTWLLDALARWEPSECGTLPTGLDGPEPGRGQGAFRVAITTDLGMRDTQLKGQSCPDIRYVVLCSGGFAREPSRNESATLSVAPWVLIEGPSQVAASLRTLGRKEAGFDR